MSEEKLLKMIRQLPVIERLVAVALISKAKEGSKQHLEALARLFEEHGIEVEAVDT